MISELDLLEAIEECEKEPVTYQSIDKLATFVTVYDHFYSQNKSVKTKIETQEVISIFNDSELAKAINGKPSNKVWEIIDELMEAVRVLQPRLYDATLDKLCDL